MAAGAAPDEPRDRQDGSGRRMPPRLARSAPGEAKPVRPDEPRNRPNLSSSTISPRRPAAAPAPETPKPVNFVNFALADPFPLRTRHRRRLACGRATLSLFALHPAQGWPG